MNKRIILLLFLLVFARNFALADEFGDVDSLWDNFGDTNFYGQKPVSDAEFDKAVESKTKKQKKNKNIPKGQEFNQSNDTQFIIATPTDYPVLINYSELKYGDQIIPIGHYQVIGEKNENKITIKLYQGHDLIAALPAVETKHDFDDEKMNYAKSIQYNDYQVRLVFGSTDFNAYVILNIEE